VRHELNKQQQAAVDSQAPDLFITAGAGSGKTRVLTERYARRVEELGNRALESVLTITFTDKAAGEIAERVREHLAEQPESCDIARELDSAWISTIHGMCARILRRHALEAGIDPLFCIGTEVQLAVLRQEAFAQVANVALDTGGAQAELFAHFRPDVLFDRVEAISEQLRALGARPQDIVRVTDWAEPLRQALPVLQGLVAEYLALEKQTDTVSRNVAAAQEFSAAVASLLDGSGDAAAVATTDLKQARTGSQELKDIAERGKEVFESTYLYVAQMAVSRFEVAFIELLEGYASAYSELKKERQLMDFEDLQSMTADLLESHPDIATRYADRFVSVMIDEFQDTNSMQTRIIQAIAPDGFVTVGDEKQSIYRFRHADVGLFRAKQAASSTTLPLAVNYRSAPELLTFFNELFSSSAFWPDDYRPLEPKPEQLQEPSATPGELPKKLSRNTSRVTALLVDRNVCGKDKHVDEAEILARHVRTLVDEGAQQGDIVILMRTMRRADTYAAALRNLGLEAFVASGGTYFDRPEVTDLEMLLRTVANPLDGEAFAHVLSGPMTGLSADALGLLRSNAGRGHLWDSARDEELQLGDPDDARLRATMEVLEWARANVGVMGLADLIHEVCERLEYDLALFSRGFEGARAWANVLKLARLAEEFELESPGNPQAFIEHLNLKREHDSREALAAFAAENVDAVRIMTVHAAKGLEFPIAIAATLGHSYQPKEQILLGVQDGVASLGMKLPHPQGVTPKSTMGHHLVAQAEAAADLEESKRVFYVACTRAEQALVLCGRADLSKPAGETTAIDWVRSALGMARPEDLCEGARSIGAATVDVHLPVPESCELEPEIRHAVDKVTLERARSNTNSLPEPPAAAIDRISYSGLERYRACGYRFYATTVARIGSRTVSDPEADSPTAFGTSVHAVLRVTKGDRLPERARIAEICRAAGLAPGRESEVEALVRGFVQSDVAGDLMNSDRTFKEVPFAVPIGGVLLDGVIDFISWNGDSALVFDYKTGHLDDRFDPTDSYRAQAECYAIAARAMGATRIRVGFVELEKGARVHEFEFTSKDVTQAQERIERSVSQILQGTFEHLPRFDVLVCAECPALGNLCPVDGPATNRRAV